MTQTASKATPYAPAGHHTATPYVIVADARAAIDFYTRAFGAVPTSLNVDDTGKVRHAEVRIGDSPIMLAEHFEFGGVSAASPTAIGGRTSMHLYLYVPDVDALFAQAIAAGAREMMPVTDQSYGDRWRRRRSVRPRLVDRYLHRRALAARGESAASHRDGRDARRSRREEREYREYSTDEQRRAPGWIACRMQRDFHHGLLSARGAHVSHPAASSSDRRGRRGGPGTGSR